MARRKTRTGSDGGSGRGDGRAWARVVPDWGRITRAATTAATIVIMGGLIAGLTLGRAPLQARAAQIRMGRSAAPLKVVFDWPTLRPSPGGGGRDGRPGQAATWLDATTRGMLEDLALAILSPDPFDSGSLARAQDALMSTGWFATRCVVTRDRDQVVHITGDWRTPFAAIRTPAGDRWVTYKGEALDKVFPQGASGLCVIHGIKAPPPVRPGEVWEGGDVQAAIGLLAYLRGTPGFEQVVGIDASEFLNRNRKQLVILTRYDTRIIWGGPAAQPLPGEWTSQAKQRQLAENLGRTGRLDAGQAQIDIRGLGGLSFAGGDLAPATQGRSAGGSARPRP